MDDHVFGKFLGSFPGPRLSVMNWLLNFIWMDAIVDEVSAAHLIDVSDQGGVPEGRRS